MSVLGTHLYQCTSWRFCERLHSASVNVFWRLFQFVHFRMDDIWALLPTPCWGSAVFEHKWHDHHAPASLFTQSRLSEFFFLFPLDEKNFQRETFCHCGRGETKNGSSTKRHQNWQVQKVIWAVKKSLHQCIASNGEDFEGDWSLNMKKTYIFISKFWVFWVPPHKFLAGNAFL